MKSVLLAGLTVLALLTTGCVTKTTHELALQELDQTRKSLSSAERTIDAQDLLINKQKARIDEQLKLIDKQKAQIDEQLQLIDKQRTEINEQQTQIDEQLGKIESNQQEIARGNSELEALDQKKMALQKELEAFQNKLGTSQSELEDSRSQLEMLKQIEAETQKRNEIYARFVAQLQKMIDGGQLTVSIEQGRIVINLPENVLFASGSATLNQEGRGALKQIAEVLGEFSERRFQIEGHTDNIPIKTDRYPSNWELSTVRALSVVHLMSEEGVASQNLSAAGFGEFHPRADNETKEGRMLNRRIEIIMLPNLDILSSELPKVTH